MISTKLSFIEISPVTEEISRRVTRNRC